MRTYQKVALVIGCLWAVVMLCGYMASTDDNGMMRTDKPFIIVSFGVPLLLWWATGTLKHMIAWFKGDKT